MSARVKHIEMQADRMGNHVNVSGLAVFELMIGKNGRVLNAKAISGHPLAIPLLLRSVNKCRDVTSLRPAFAFFGRPDERYKRILANYQPSQTEHTRK